MDPMLAMITYFAGNFAPQGWAFCNGASLQVQQNPALFSLLGNRFGGDGVHNFNLPNIPDLNGLKALICVEGIYPSRP